MKGLHMMYHMHTVIVGACVRDVGDVHTLCVQRDRKQRDWVSKGPPLERTLQNAPNNSSPSKNTRENAA